MRIRIMQRLGLVHLFVFLLLLAPAMATADIASNCSISPSTAQLLDGTLPPQSNVEMFVYSTVSTGTEYTLVCDTPEQPAAVVVLPAEMTSVSYDGSAGTISVRFKNVPYIEGTSIPAPPGTTTFSIAFVYASPGGVPAEMRGSWMATNIPPFGLDMSGVGGWELIAPSEEEPFFGYRLNGPEGVTGFFQMFIPETMRALLAGLASESPNAPVSLEWSDLAIFNDNEQASMSLIPQESGGALVDILVKFTEGVTETPVAQTLLAARMARAAAGAGVDKRVTVGEAEAVSLTADILKPKRAETIKLYGWVKACTAGDKVKLTSKLAGNAARAAGAKRYAKYVKNGWKRPVLQQDCSFSQTYKAKKLDVFKAIYKPKGGKAVKSRSLRMPVTKK